jgi:hypothetical protein
MSTYWRESRAALPPALGVLASREFCNEFDFMTMMARHEAAVEAATERLIDRFREMAERGAATARARDIEEARAEGRDEAERGAAAARAHDIELARAEGRDEEKRSWLRVAPSGAEVRSAERGRPGRKKGANDTDDDQRLEDLMNDHPGDTQAAKSAFIDETAQKGNVERTTAENRYYKARSRMREKQKTGNVITGTMPQAPKSF